MSTNGTCVKMADIERRLRRIRNINRFIRVDRRFFKDRSNPLEVLSRDEVRERYRFFPETIVYICGLLDLARPTQRSQPLTALLTTLVSLHYFATNCHHIVTADLHGVSRSSVSRAVSQFTDQLCGRMQDFIPFPEDKQACQRQFFNIAGFPNVVGVVDGTQIRIQGPTEHEEDYVNRKGFHSINVQMICDARFMILDVVAKWPGSVHDSRIFRDSEVGGRLERGEIDGLLLGDSGYPCRKYLMTPYHAPQTHAQERFNESLCKTRVVVEQSFGVMKRRFPCLSYGLRVSPPRACKITVSCVILHNIGIQRNDIYARVVEVANQQPEVLYDGPGTGNHYRDFLANAFFA
ncbi:putative nuclease HARBI1 isoform X1 [Mercenaria mercenaria]|uniref:putative nuclease HARBI1 isoform X1 n=1 Tax=Mercenaria mercenaria TaxID=6596 RepID=UPI00234F4718|nr:putative nuclease HARBI1 isoform X1 [Mercenaria mercenaria]